MSLSNIDAISSAFSPLLDHDFFDWLSKVRSRSSLEHSDSPAPIVADVQNLRRILRRTFEVRHVLVHEFPETSPYAGAEIDELLAAATTFIDAADEGFTQLLYGLYPITQAEMNRVAREESDAASAELANLADEVMQKEDERAILAVQAKWESFAKAEAERIAAPSRGGSIWRLDYYTAFKALTSDRIRQLRSWIEDEFPSA
jgi:uncharacterized protein YecT (DUF1311 family)